MKNERCHKREIIDCFREIGRRDGCTANHFPTFIAKALNIKSPSLYNHFKNIREVKTALTAETLTELNDQLRRVLVGKSKRRSDQAYAQTYQSFAFQNQAVYELLISVPHTNEEILLEGIHETDQIILQIFDAFSLSKEEKVHRSRELRKYDPWVPFVTFLGFFTNEPNVSPEESYVWMIDDFIATLPIK